MLFRFSTALVAAASIAGAAQAHAQPQGSPGRDAQILSELPADAPPGECYARVKVPGEPAGPPPVTVGAQWVMNPGPPGSPGPVWCLVPTEAAPVAAPSVERYGWIRVLCDTDATPDRIRGVQKRLHDRGYYRGDMSGRYDSATAAAVGQFQSREHISHGGYLSLQTLDVLEAQGAAVSAPPVYAAAPAAPAATYNYGYQQAYVASAPACPQTCYAAPPPPPPPPVYYQPCCQQPVYQPPVYQQPVYPAPCCAAAYPAGGWYAQGQYVQGGYAQGYSQQGYGGGYYAQGPVPAYASAQASAYASAYAGASAGAYVSSGSAIQNGWLTWRGKTRY